MEADIDSPENAPNPAQIRMIYTNWRGETDLRRITPQRLYWGEVEWHPGPQWLLEALDLDKGETRTFALRHCTFLSS